jgi:hypothetical protein
MPPIAKKVSEFVLNDSELSTCASCHIKLYFSSVIEASATGADFGDMGNRICSFLDGEITDVLMYNPRCKAFSMPGAAYEIPDTQNDS